MTRNGKLDKRALTEIEAKTAREYVAPRMEAEKAICTIYSDVIGFEKVGVNDNFFEIGGHSLKAVKCVLALKEYGYYVDVRDIFVYPLVSSLAKHIAYNVSVSILEEPGRNIEIDKNCDEIRQIEKMYSTCSDISCVYIPLPMQRYFLMDEHIVSQTAFQIKGTITKEEIVDGIMKIAEIYSIFRTGYSVTQQQMYEYSSYISDIPYFVCTDNCERAEELKNKFNNYYENSDVIASSKYLNRMILVKNAENDYTLRLCIHHSVFDGSAEQELNGIISDCLNSNAIKPEPAYSEYVCIHSDIRAEDIPEYVKIRSEYIEYMAKKNKIIANTQYNLQIILPSSNFRGEEILTDPINKILGIICELSGLSSLDKLPFLLLKNSFGKVSMGLYMDLIPSLYDTHSGSISGGMEIAKIIERKYSSFVVSRDDSDIYGSDTGIIFNYILSTELPELGAQIKLYRSVNSIVQATTSNDMAIIKIPIWSDNDEQLPQKIEAYFELKISSEE